jgi:hypothetical protein
MNAFVKGQIIPIEGDAASVQFDFNPKQIDGPEAKAGWDVMKVAGAEHPILQHSCRDPVKLGFTLQIVFWGGSQSQVEDQVERVLDLTAPSVRGAGVNHPPRVKLILAGFKKRRTCVVESVKPLYSKIMAPFTATPYYAEVTITFLERPQNGQG